MGDARGALARVVVGALRAVLSWLAAELQGAAGVPGLIVARVIRPGAVVVDVGVARRGGKIAGDAAEGVEQVAGWLSPNPGGVGPMTRAMLLSNVVQIAERS